MHLYFPFSNDSLGKETHTLTERQIDDRQKEGYKCRQVHEKEVAILVSNLKSLS